MTGRPDVVTFEPKDFRDVHWCPYLNEPVIVEYRGADKQSHGSIKYCVNCNRFMDDSLHEHEFICHIGKP